MAAKKIGAIIALDGEKEFKQNVTNCNKSLTALKSEMSLVKAEYEGQQNSLEALTKKHEILIEILKEQTKKQSETEKGLEYAKKEYERAADNLQILNQEEKEHKKGLEDLQEEYKITVSKLEEMKKAGNASKESVEQQESAIKSLSEEIEREQDVLKKINAALEKGNKNYVTAGNHIKEWETKLNTAKSQVIKATREVEKNSSYMKEAEQSTDQCAKSIDNFGKEVKKAEETTVKWTTAVKMNLVNTMTDAVKQGVGEACSAILDMESAQKQLQASTGATAGEMKEYKSIMEDLYSESYGENIQDVAQAMAMVKQYTGEIDSDNLKELTENGIAMRDVFNMDLSETIRGVDALMDHMGLTSEEAFDLMAKGAQKGLDKSGELADNISEYSQIWAQAGFSAQEMFAVLENGLDSGAYNLDKINDFVKEFSVSLADGRIEENIESFSYDTKILFKEWKIGKATTKDVFRSVIKDLATAENQQKALSIASNTWSALGEDNALKVITSLNKTNQSFENVYGTMEDIKNIKYDTVEARIKNLGRTFTSEIAEPIAEKALPAIEEGLDLVIDNMDTLIPLVGGIAAGTAVFKGVAGAVSAYVTVTKGATAAQAALNAVTLANPIMAVATALTAAAAAAAIYINTAGEAAEKAKELAESNQRVCDSANQVSESSKELISGYADSTAEMKAQSEHAEVLAKNIEKLTEKENLSNEEKAVMQQYIAQLNESVPELNLAYDEQAGKLNMTNEELEKYLSQSQEQIGMQAAQEYAIELLKKKSELQIQEIKLENEKAELLGENGEKEIDFSHKMLMLTNGLATGNMDYYQSVKKISEAQKENTEAIENNKQSQEDIEREIEAASELLEQYNLTWSEVTQKTDANTEAANINAEAQSNLAQTNKESAQIIVENYNNMQQEVSEVLENQMNMFERFNEGTELSSETLLENMQSQIDGVTNWAENMGVLAERGINQGILDKLAEMGPEGSNYVQAFTKMTDEQLKQANELWSESLDMKKGVNDSVREMIETYTTALSGGKERVSAVLADVGSYSIQGLVEGINNGSRDITNAGRTIGSTLEEGTNAQLEIQSPSKVFYRIGTYTVQGLKEGITDNKSTVIKAVHRVADAIQEEAKKEMGKNKFKPIGENIASGIASGIKNRTKQVEKAVVSLSSKIKDAGLNKRTLYDEGKNVSEGLANGISAGRSTVINAVAKVCNAAVSEAKGRLKIHSPSKVFEELGGYTAEGFGIGYQKKMSDVNNMIRDSMDPPRMTGVNGNGVFGNQAGTGKIVVEFPIYLGKEYTRTEIVEIALEGIAQRQNQYIRAKGAGAGV